MCVCVCVCVCVYLLCFEGELVPRHAFPKRNYIRINAQRRGEEEREEGEEEEEEEEAMKRGPKRKR